MPKNIRSRKHLKLLEWTGEHKGLIVQKYVKAHDVQEMEEQADFWDPKELACFMLVHLYYVVEHFLSFALLISYRVLDWRNSAAFGHTLSLNFADNYVCSKFLELVLLKFVHSMNGLELVLIVKWLSVRRTWFLFGDKFE